MGSASRKRSRLEPKRLNEVTAETFAELQAPHPYGVLPSGNRFFSQLTTPVDDDDKAGGINAMDLLPDTCWNSILAIMDGSSLAILSQTCKFLYVAAHQPEFWRDLVLKEQNRSILARVGPSWKDTFVLLHSNLQQENTQVNITYRPHSPMCVSGVYSDVFYRQHSCRSFAIPLAWLNSESIKENVNRDCLVPKVHVSDMTTQRFIDEFELPNLPVLVQGAAATWPAFQKWKDPSYWAAHTQGQTFRATSGVAQQPAQFTWESYRSYCIGENTQDDARLLEEGPLYLFDRTALKPDSVLWKDYMYSLRKSCPYWDAERIEGAGDDVAVGHDLFGLLGEGRRPDHTWLIVGPRRSGSVFHIDPNCTHAWNAAIVGRKRWIFYPPGVTPPGVHPSADGDEVALPLSIGEWLFQFWDEHCKRKSNRVPKHERPLECTACPGDVLFVPHGWWHMVINLDDVNIAITHNYVALSNLPNVLKFLDTKRDQVSGCRDRADSIKPESLFEEFKHAMELTHGNWLRKAQVQPDWTCAAWTNNRVERNDKSLILESQDEHKQNIMEKAKMKNKDVFSFSFSTA